MNTNKFSIKLQSLVMTRIRSTKNECLSWDKTVEWAALLGLETAPILYRGIWNEETIKKCYSKISVFGGEQEGYVVRTTDGFQYDDFKNSVAKFVRKNHVQTDQHWLSKSVIPNGLKQAN